MTVFDRELRVKAWSPRRVSARSPPSTRNVAASRQRYGSRHPAGRARRDHHEGHAPGAGPSLRIGGWVRRAATVLDSAQRLARAFYGPTSNTYIDVDDLGMVKPVEPAVDLRVSDTVGATSAAVTVRYRLGGSITPLRAP